MTVLGGALLVLAFSQPAWDLTISGDTLRVKGPRGMVGTVLLPVETLPCTGIEEQGEIWLSCPLAMGAQLEFSRAGYEVRRLDAGPPPWPAVWDLDDDGWQPAPLRLLLDPPELRFAALVVWLEGEEIVTATADEGGTVLGPRVPPGQRFALAVVGETVEGAILEGERATAEDPLRVDLSEGRSWVALCRDPWSGTPVTACTVTAGARPRLMRESGMARLDSRGRGRPVGLLHVLDGRHAEIVQAEAAGFPPLLLADPAGPVLELTLPRPRSLRVLLRDGSTDRPVAGRVLVTHRRERITLAEERSDHRGSVEFTVGDGEYELFVEAGGYSRARQLVTVDKPKVEVRLALRPAAAVQGRVIGEAGEPLPGALVMGSPREEAGAENVSHTATGSLGEFTLPLAGKGPWVVRANLDGFGPAEAVVDLPLTPLTLRMPRRCEVTLQLLFADGTPFEATTVVAINLSAPQVVQARGQGEGRFLASLSPGAWLVVDEARRASARVEVPAPCTGWGTIVVMTAGPGRESPSRAGDPSSFQRPSPLR